MRLKITFLPSVRPTQEQNPRTIFRSFSWQLVEINLQPKQYDVVASQTLYLRPL